MTPKCPDCRRDQEDCICFPSAKMKRTIDRQAAQIEMLREALDEIVYDIESNLFSKAQKQAIDALSTTPDQALEQFAAKVRGQCAKGIQSCGLCGRDFANEIRAIKELP